MSRHLFVPFASLLTLVGCTVDPGDPYTSLTGAASFATTNNPEEESGDGDGDGGTGTGDGDGDTGDGDGDTGDGDGDTGDGDGDAGDGDGDAGDGDGDAGDGDGDPSLNCGWNAGGQPPGYYCGFMGEDPGGTPIGCPPGLVEEAACGEVTGAGCCDGNDNWYCADDGQGNEYLVLEACG